MWHQYGVIPENNEGIYLQIQDIPNNWLRFKGGNTEDTTYYETGSLADICGFPMMEELRNSSRSMKIILMPQRNTSKP